MPTDDFREILGDLPQIGRRIKHRAYRQVWKFKVADRHYYLKFYPRLGMFLKRLVRGNPAAREYRRLQWLAENEIPAPKAVALLSDVVVEEKRGDAVVLDAIEPSQSLMKTVDERLLLRRDLPDHYAVAAGLCELVGRLHTSFLGHSDLHLGNVLCSDGRMYLLDAYAVHRGGVTVKDLMLLAHSAQRLATRTDLLRFWWLIRPGARLPATNTLRPKLCRKFVSKCTTEGEYFGRLNGGDGWRGFYYKRFPTPQPWSQLSRMSFTEDDWQLAWPKLIQAIDDDEFTIIKRTASGDVLRGSIQAGERTLDVFIKRPRRKYWHRYLNEIGRGGRSRRAWRKAWSLAIRNLPTALPLLMMERRRMGYLTDSVIVFEAIEGATLAKADLNQLTATERDNLMRRTGRLLREMERDGLYHWDAKAYNFIVASDHRIGPRPVLVDVDGIRSFQYTRFALHRLLKSMRDNPTFTPADSRSLCLGYAPYAKIKSAEASS